VRIDVDKSAYHHLSQNEIASGNPIQHLFWYIFFRLQMKRPLARNHIKPVVAATPTQRLKPVPKQRLSKTRNVCGIGLMGISGVSSKYDLDDAHY
jgi:hypothetical protein